MSNGIGAGSLPSDKPDQHSGPGRRLPAVRLGSGTCLPFLVIGAALAWGPVAAQNAPPVPSQATEPDVRLRQLEERPTPSLGDPIVIPSTSPGRPPANSSEVTFELRDLVINGASAFPPETLRPLFQDQIGRMITLTELYEIAARIEAFYREAGFFITRTIVPAQEVADGRYRLEVIEGFITRVEMDLSGGADHGRVEAILREVEGQRPLKLQTLERALLLANDIPGIAVSVLLRQDEDQRGGAVLVANVVRKRVGGFASIDNQGSSFTGRDTVVIGTNISALTDYADQFGLTAVVTNPIDGEGSWVIQGSAGIGIGRSGLRLQLIGSYGESRPNGPPVALDVLDLESDSTFASAVLSYPFLRTRDLSLTGDVSFDYLNTNTDQASTASNGPFRLYEDKIRTAAISMRLDFKDTLKGRNVGTVSFRKGLPILDASRAGDLFLTRPDASGVFSSLQASFLRLQEVSESVSVLMEMSGQLAFNEVLSGEEFTVGGRRFGRGYNPAQLAGDSGVGATLELQYTQPTDMPLLESYQLFSFLDYGRVDQRSDESGGIPVADPSQQGTLLSVGAGVRARANENFALEATVAQPVGGRPTQIDRSSDVDGQAPASRSPQLLVQATAQF